jgi:hypothetical protein
VANFNNKKGNLTNNQEKILQIHISKIYPSTMSCPYQANDSFANFNDKTRGVKEVPIELAK